MRPIVNKAQSGELTEHASHHVTQGSEFAYFTPDRSDRHVGEHMSLHYVGSSAYDNCPLCNNVNIHSDILLSRTVRTYA